MDRKTMILAGVALVAFYLLTQNRRPSLPRVRGNALTVPLPQWDIGSELNRIIQDQRNGIVYD
jgi:hypothetical protein